MLPAFQSLCSKECSWKWNKYLGELVKNKGYYVCDQGVLCGFAVFQLTNLDAVILLPWNVSSFQQALTSTVDFSLDSPSCHILCWIKRRTQFQKSSHLVYKQPWSQGGKKALTWDCFPGQYWGKSGSPSSWLFLRTLSHLKAQLKNYSIPFQGARITSDTQKPSYLHPSSLHPSRF